MFNFKKNDLGRNWPRVRGSRRLPHGIQYIQTPLLCPFVNLRISIHIPASHGKGFDLKIVSVTSQINRREKQSTLSHFQGKQYDNLHG